MIRFAMPFADDCFVYHDGSPDYYDDIVDKTEFRPDSENVRSARASGGAMSGGGLYDFPDGVVPDSDGVTKEIIALRNGKLDKAEVQALKDQTDKALKNAVSEAKEKKLLEQKEALIEARQSYLDDLSGFSADSVGKEVKNG